MDEFELDAYLMALDAAELEAIGELILDDEDLDLLSLNLETVLDLGDA